MKKNTIKNILILVLIVFIIIPFLFMILNVNVTEGLCSDASSKDFKNNSDRIYINVPYGKTNEYHDYF